MFMGRIFEALRHPHSNRPDNLPPKEPASNDAKVPDRRRSPRRAFDIPVYVYGHEPGKEPFHEEAHTLHVNANGALLLLSVPVDAGQRLLLTNTLTQKEQECCVVFLGTRRTRTIETGVAFPLPNADFWHVSKASADKTTLQNRTE
jgi:hypothetical protein